MFKKEQFLLGLLFTTAAAVVAIPVGILTAMAADKAADKAAEEKTGKA